MKNKIHLFIIALIAINVIMTGLILKKSVSVDLNESSAALTGRTREFVRYIDESGRSVDKEVTFTGTIAQCAEFLGSSGCVGGLDKIKSEICAIRSRDQAECTRACGGDANANCYQSCIDNKKNTRKIDEISKQANSTKYSRCCGQYSIDKVVCK